MFQNWWWEKKSRYWDVYNIHLSGVIHVHHRIVFMDAILLHPPTSTVKHPLYLFIMCFKSLTR